MPHSSPSQKWACACACICLMSEMEWILSSSCGRGPDRADPDWRMPQQNNFTHPSDTTHKSRRDRVRDWETYREKEAQRRYVMARMRNMNASSFTHSVSLLFTASLQSWIDFTVLVNNIIRLTKQRSRFYRHTQHINNTQWHIIYK